MNLKNYSMKKQLIMAGLFFFFVTGGFSQKPVEGLTNDADTSAVNKLLQLSKEKLGTSPDSSISIALQAVALAEKIDFQKGKALALKN